jgi:succinyl-diaminopimelate desuccinylase
MSPPPKTRIESLVGDLVRIRTENPPGNEASGAEYIYDWFDERDIDVTLVREPYEDRPQVVARIGNSSPTVVLNGHVDVVPVGDPDDWSVDPYGGEVLEGVLYGRGSADMKSGLALAMLAAVDLAEEIEANELDGSLMIQAAVGEERMEPGTETLIKEGYGDGADYAIVLEPKGMQTSTCQKGVCWYKITVEGEAAHAGRAEEGTNAVDLAKPVLGALERYDQRVRQRRHELVGQPSVTVTGVEAGTAQNVVPARTIVTVDRRFLPGMTTAVVDEEIDQLLADVEDAHGVAATWERTGGCESAEIDPHCDLATTLRHHANDVAGIPTEPWATKASDDARHFVNAAGIEAVTWGPAPADEAHRIDEGVALEDLEVGLEVLKRALRDLLTASDTDSEVST